MKILKSLLVVFLLVVMSACGGDDREKLYVLNWGEYLDPELISAFEKEYNVKVVYEEVESTEAMYSKISSNATAYDIAFPSEYTIELMIQEDLLNEIDKDIVTNFSNVDSKYFELTDFDSNGSYYAPYFTGSIGIMYNKDLVAESDLNGWSTLWDKKYENQVYLYDSIRDTMSVGALYNGYSVNTTDKDELAKIEKSLSTLNSQVRGYGTDDLKNLIAAGDGAMAVVYSGDYLVTYADQMETSGDVNVGYYIPEEGTNVWLDGIVIPKSSKNTELANKFINFMLDAENAKINAKYVGYTTTNAKVFEELISSNDEIYQTNAYSVPNEIAANSEVYKNLDLEYNELYSEIFIRIKN